MKTLSSLIALLVVGSIIGCSGISTKSIKTDEDEKQANGFRYYERSPYILVYFDGNSLNSKLLYLPDRTRKRSVELFEFLAKNTTKLTFSNGVLTSSDSEGDSTEFPKAVIETAKDVAIAAAKGAFSVEDTDGFLIVPRPHLYKLVNDDEVSKLIAFKIENGDSNPFEIKVNIPTKEEQQ